MVKHPYEHISHQLALGVQTLITQSPKSTKSWGMHSGNQSHCQFSHSIPAYSFYGEGLWDAGTFNQASPSSLFSEARSVFPPHGNLSPVMFCFQIPTIPKPGVSSLCYLSMLLSCGDFPRLGPLWDIHNFKQNVVREIV